MRRKFLAFLALAVASLTPWLSTSAQGIYEDVTATYLVNPSFEYSDASNTEYGANVETLDVFGWTLVEGSNNFLGGSGYRNTLIANNTYANQDFGKCAAADGNHYFFNRKGWNSGSAVTGTVQQTTTLPAGTYFFSIQYKAANAYDNDNNAGQSGSTLGVKVSQGDVTLAETGMKNVFANAKQGARNNIFAGDTWHEYGVYFTVPTEGEVAFQVLESLKSNRVTAVALDNARLYRVNTECSVETEGIGLPMTGLIIDPGFNALTGWKTTNCGLASTTSKEMHAMFPEKWSDRPSGVGTPSIEQTISLPAGKYSFSAYIVGRNLNTQLYVKFDGQTVESEVFDNVVKETRSVDFLLLEPGNVTLGYKALGQADSFTSGDGWFAIDDAALALLRFPSAAELNSAFYEAQAAIISHANEAIAATDNAEVKARYQAIITAANEAADMDAIAAIAPAVESADALAANAALLAGATLDAPVAYALGAWEDHAGYQNKGTFTTPYSGVVNPEFNGTYNERWNGSPKVGDLFYQKFENMPSGVYGFKACFFANTPDAVYLFVGDGVSELMTYDTQAAAYSNAKYMSANGAAIDNTLEIGMRQDEALCNWAGLGDAQLIYYGPDATKEDVAAKLALEIKLISYNSVYAQAQALEGQTMSTAVATALTEAMVDADALTIATIDDAISALELALANANANIAAHNAAATAYAAYDADADMNADAKVAADADVALYEADSLALTTEQLNAMAEHINAANASASLYGNKKAAIDNMARLLSEITIATDEARAAYQARYEELLAKYNNGTLTADDAVYNPYETNYGIRGNVDFIDFMMSAWGGVAREEGVVAAEYWDGMHVNSWSTENAGIAFTPFEAPFYEYWTGNGSLADKNITATVTGLTPGAAYKVSALVRTQTSGRAAVTGISLVATNGLPTAINGATPTVRNGNGHADDSNNFRISRNEAVGYANEDGVLEITFAVEGTNASWLAFKNVTVELFEAVTVDANATFDFSAATAVDSGVATYDYDVKEGTEYCNLLPVAGWVANSSANGTIGAVYAIGSGITFSNGLPAETAEGLTEGNVLGIASVWGGIAQYTKPVTLKAGHYTLKVNVYNANTGNVSDLNANLIGFVESNGTQHFAATKKYANEWTLETVEFNLADDTEGYLSLGIQHGTGSGAAHFLAIESVAIEYSPLETLDLEAFNAAYEAAQAKADAMVYGFDAGEYAPYNVAPVAGALAQAAAINSTSTQADVDAATEALDAYNAVEANAAEVNAFSAMVETQAAGLAGNTANSIVTVAEGDDNYDNFAMLDNNEGERSALCLSWNNNTGAWALLGQAEGYNMPLKANVEYLLSFDFATYTSNCYPTVLVATTSAWSVDQAAALRSYQPSARISSGVYTHVAIRFTLAQAGDARVKIYMPGGDNKGDMLIRNLSIVRAAEVDNEFTEVAFLPEGDNANMVCNGAAANVVLTDGVSYTNTQAIDAARASYTRNVTAGNWNAICLPFTAEVPAGCQAFILHRSELDADGDPAVVFHPLEADEMMEANTPYLLKANKDVLTITATDVTLASADGNTKAEVNEGLYMEGVYAPFHMGISNVYGLAGGEFKWTSNEKYLKPFRAYLYDSWQDPNGIRRIVVEDETEGIRGIEFEMEDGVFYDLQGRRVENPAPGIYIFNGAKVLVK